MALAGKSAITNTLSMNNFGHGTRFSALAATLLLWAAAASAAVFSEQNAASGAVAPKMTAPAIAGSSNYPPVEVSSDFDSGQRRRIGADLAALYQIKGGGASALHQQVFGDVSGRNYLAFFTKRVSFIGKADSKDAYAYSYPGSRGIWLGEKPMQDDTPQIRRISTFMHEARHAGGENGGWTHAVCPLRPQAQQAPAPVLSGREACDDAALGAYGIQAVFLYNVARYCSNCSGKMQMDAAMFSQELPSRIIDRDEQDLLLRDMGR